ncbi:hypothetical protein HJFPF1_08395 [Paramyrothecium foliicola]|nr:hypothetical protein HJFPF1_08395 [Paramyrothecium foliicola]
MPYHPQDSAGMMSQRQTKPTLRRVMPIPQPPSPRQHISSSQGSTPTFRPPQWQGSMSSEPSLDSFASNQGFNHHHTPPASSTGSEHAPTLSSLDTSNMAIQYQVNVLKQRLESMETIMTMVLSSIDGSDNFHSV